MDLSRRQAMRLFSAAIPALSTMNAFRPAVGQESDARNVPSGFDRYTEDYAEFCAIPADQRRFYALDDDHIVSERLDEATWRPTRSPAKKNLPIRGGSWDDVPLVSPFPDLSGEGPYKATWDSLLQYEAPEWYRDAKFGMWAHWSPQCVPEQGDWYARQMYIEGSPQYQFHLTHYGHPSRFGYKDLCAEWTLLNWDPDELIQRYKRAGAKFFLALANH